MKTCTKCGVEKTPGEFTKDKSREDGLYPQCKACRKAFREANREKILKQKREHWHANRDEIGVKRRAKYQDNPKHTLALNKAWREANREKIRESRRAYRDTNREKIRASKKRYRDANKEKILEKSRAYYAANPHKFLIHGQRRRARERNADGSATAKDIQSRLDAHGHKCIFCGSTEDLHLDHVKPLSKGGSNWPSNLAPACGPCNLSKAARWGPDMVAWGTERFGPERVKSWPFPQK